VPSAVTEALSAWGRAASELFALRLAFPWLAGGASRAAWGTVALAATVAALALFPARARRAALPAAVLAWAAFGASPAFAAALFAAAVFFAFTLRARTRLGARLAASAALCAGLLAVSRTVGGFAGAAAWQLAALFGVRAASAAVDAGPEGAGSGETLLYFCGGAPASFLGAYYTFASFRAAAAEGRPRAAGVVDAGAGQAWLAAAAALHAAAAAAAGPAAAAPGLFAWAGLWAYCAAMWAAELAMWMGAYGVVEGLQRLCGLDLPGQFDRPWLSASPLEFWRRYSAQNRAYLLKYSFFPLRRRGVPPAAAVALTFALSAGLNALRFAGVFLAAGAGPRPAVAAAATFGLFFALFGAAASVEAWIRPGPPRTAAARTRRRAATAIALVWLWTPLFFWPDPARASPRAALSLWAETAGRMAAPWSAR
jgi:hypothetical protein